MIYGLSLNFTFVYIFSDACEDFLHLDENQTQTQM